MLLHEGTNLANCLNCIVRAEGVCGALTKIELQELRRISRKRTFRHGTRIMSGHDSTEFVASIITGVVKVTKVLIDGRQQIVGLLFPTDSVGRALGSCDSYFVEAATDVELCCFERVGFERMLEAYSGLSRRLLQQAQSELNSAHEWMVLLGRKTAEERVASLFLMLATRSPLTGNTKSPIETMRTDCELYLKREEIADFLGLTLETVCRQISALKRNGVVKFNGMRRFSVPDLMALAAIAG